MKKITFLLFATSIILFASCTKSPQQIAEKNVKAHMEKMWDKGYKSISFTDLSENGDDGLPITDSVERNIKFYIFNKMQFKNGYNEWSKEQNFYIGFDKDLNIIKTENRTK